MKQENIIKKLTISIGGKDVDVTPKQAKDLYEALGELIGSQKVVKEYVPYQQWAWQPYRNPFWVTTTGTSPLTVSASSTVTNMTYDATSNTAYLSV